MPLITLDGVSYRYPDADRPALSEITTAVEPGEVILLRGASGSGKSTLLRCLNGLVPHSTGGQFRGRVVVCGLDTREHPPRRLGMHIGFVFQHPDAQFVLEDVEAELAFGLENLGLRRPLMRKRVEEVIDQVGINPLRRRRIDTLSGGERQRVAIAAALAMHPDALVLDEPTSQLDPQAAEDVLQVVLRLVAELGMTTVIAEHRVERIAPFVDRIWTLDAGVLRDQPPRVALAEGGARPPVVDLALRAGWTPIPLGLRDARIHAPTLPHKGGGRFPQWLWADYLPGRGFGPSLRRCARSAGTLDDAPPWRGRRLDGSERIRKDHALAVDRRTAAAAARQHLK